MNELISRKYPPIPLVAVGALIINPDTEEVLLVKRKAEPGKGKYSIPGGLVELGETLVEAVRREVREEVALDIDILGVIYLDNIIERDSDNRVVWHYVLIDFLARPIGKEAKAGSDAEETVWVNLDEAFSYPLTSHTERLLRLINEQKKSGIAFFGLDNTCSLLVLSSFK